MKSKTTSFEEEVRVATDLWLPFVRQYGIASIFLPVAGIYDSHIAGVAFDTMPIRVLMCIAVISMCTHKRWSREWQERAHFVWSAVVIFTLPFGFGVMLTQAAANAPLGTEVHYMMLLQYVTALFLLILVCNSMKVTMVFWIVGTILALSPLCFQDIGNSVELSRVTTLSFGAYATMIFVGSVANQNIRLTEEAKAEAAHTIGSNIAHELRTPLAAIRMYAGGTSNQLETLLDGYEIASNAGLVEKSLRASQVEIMRTFFRSIEKEVNYSNTIIDMLLIKSSRKIPDRRDFETLRVSTVIKDAMERYPANNQRERDILRIEIIRDFEVVAPRLLLVHVFFNLLKNAVYYSQKSSNSSVRVQIGERLSEENTVIVEDNGPGLSGADSNEIFDRFFTTTLAGEGTGIGLSFCRLVMNEIGGSIAVLEKNVSTTVFVLKFPTGRKNLRRKWLQYI